MSTVELSKSHIIIAAEQVISAAAYPLDGAEKMPAALHDLVTSGMDSTDKVRMVSTVIRKMNVDAIHAAYKGRYTPTDAMHFTDEDLAHTGVSFDEYGQGYGAKVLARVYHHLDEEQHPLLRDGEHDALAVTSNRVERLLLKTMMHKHGVSAAPDFGAVLDDIPLLKQNGHMILEREAGLRSVLRALEASPPGSRVIYGGEVLQALIAQHGQAGRVLPKPYEDVASQGHLNRFRAVSRERGVPDDKRNVWPDESAVMRTLVGVDALIHDLSKTPAAWVSGLDGTPFSENDKAFYIERLSAVSDVLLAAANEPAKALNIDMPFDVAMSTHREVNDPNISLFTLTKDVEHAARPLPEATPIYGALKQREKEPGVVVVSNRQVAHAMAAKFNLGLAEHKVSRNTLQQEFKDIERIPVEAERLKVGLLALYQPETTSPLNDALAFADEMGYHAGTPEGDLVRHALALHWQQPGIVEQARHGYVASEVLAELKGHDTLALNRDPEPERATRSIV
jgi:hypothetical protein